MIVVYQEVPNYYQVCFMYSCDEAYLEKFNVGNINKYSLLLTVFPRSRLDPKNQYLASLHKQKRYLFQIDTQNEI